MKKATKLICVFLLGCLITATVLAPRAESRDPWYLPILQWAAGYANQLMEAHNTDPDAHPYLPREQAPYLVDAAGRVAGPILTHDYWGFSVLIEDPYMLLEISASGEICGYPVGLRYYELPDCEGSMYGEGHRVEGQMFRIGGEPYIVRYVGEEVTIGSYKGSDSAPCVSSSITGPFPRMDLVTVPEQFTPPLKIEMR